MGVVIQLHRYLGYGGSRHFAVLVRGLSSGFKRERERHELCVCLGMVYTDGEERETARQRERGESNLGSIGGAPLLIFAKLLLHDANLISST